MTAILKKRKVRRIFGMKRLFDGRSDFLTHICLDVLMIGIFVAVVYCN